MGDGDEFLGGEVTAGNGSQEIGGLVVVVAEEVVEADLFCRSGSCGRRQWGRLHETRIRSMWRESCMASSIPLTEVSSS